MSRDAVANGRSALAQLTEGTPLPLPVLPPHVLASIVDGIHKAWSQVPGEQARNAAEPALNAMLGTQLNRLIDRDHRLRMVVFVVHRGVESVNYDGSKLEKRPDLSVTLTAGIRARNFPFTIECKLIDEAARKTVDLYCKKGVKRFVDGEYAWARPEAAMLAYVRDGSRVVPDLSTHLERRAAQDDDPYRTQRLPDGGNKGPPRSTHGRCFRYPDRSPGDDPGPITLLHIWLDARRAGPR